MIALTSQIDFILVGSALMLALLGFGVAVIMPGIDRWSKYFFEVYFLCIVLYTGFSLVEELSYIYPDMQPVQAVSIYLNTLTASVLIPLITVYLLHCCGESWRHSTVFYVITVLWIGFFIMLNVTPFTTWFYYINSKNQLSRGFLYPLMLIILGAMMVVNLIAVIRRRNRLSKRCYIAFLVGLLPMIIAILIHFFVFVFQLFSIGIFISGFSMFVIILSDQIGQYLNQQRELAHQRTSILVLQMRPHFIYNTMMSIYYLCKQDPDLAQQVTLDFTTYLRKNFTAIASEEPIPFTAELEHTRAYLAVEQAQFDNRLFAYYDTPHIDFRISPLTLQPIVENAVKHGMDPDSEPLHIFIQTRHNGSCTQIIVRDTGSGFDPAKAKCPNMALSNIQQRLEIMCNGSMTITQREGGGTEVTVTIPDSPTD